MEPYKDPILRKYVDMLQTAMPMLKVVYYGDPIKIPISSLPALVIAKLDTSVKNETNVEDLQSMRISITLVTDVRNDISDDKTMVSGTNMLYDLMEGRQETTYQLKTNTILYQLRHNVELDPAQNLRTDLSTITKVDYGMTLGKRQEKAWSIEGIITLTAHFIQVR
jgi:hypothetical protein